MVFFPPPCSREGDRLFPGPALCLSFGDDGSTTVLWMTGHAGFGSAPGADELSAFLSGSPRDAMWDSQAEPTHWGESRGMKCGMC